MKQPRKDLATGQIARAAKYHKIEQINGNYAGYHGQALTVLALTNW